MMRLNLLESRFGSNTEMASLLPTLQSRTTTIDHVGEDLLQNIVARLPALSFASVACVSRSWNLVCSRILCRPKLSSACSFNPSLHLAVAEVVDEVLSEPIRPHFAIASVGPSFSMQEAYDLITAKLGSKVPLVINCSSGIIGRDVLSHELIEWKVTEEDEEEDDLLENNDDPEGPLPIPEGTNKAIMLVVGFLPGMKVGTIPLLKQYDDPRPCAVKIDKLITDIREFSTSISGCTSPAAIIMFTQLFQRDITTVMDKMDYAMSPETVIVGDCCCYFIHTSKSSRNIAPRYERVPAGVALVFVNERSKPLGSGETQFHAVLSSGLIPVGPAYKATSVKEQERGFSASLTARREGSEENVDGRSILNLAYEEIADRTNIRHFYIGVTKRRQHSTETDNVGWMTSIAFHEVLKDNQETLLVNGVGINTGDTFRVYHPHSTTSLSSVANVSDHMRSFKQGSTNGGDDKLEVVGGLIFASVGRGESFFGQPNVESSPFLENFPGVALGGMFCAREIGRGNLSPYVKESEEQKSVRCCVHQYGAVYLIVSYTP